VEPAVIYRVERASRHVHLDGLAHQVDLTEGAQDEGWPFEELPPEEAASVVASKPRAFDHVSPSAS
jgi:hypothetical protein